MEGLPASFLFGHVGVCRDGTQRESEEGADMVFRSPQPLSAPCCLRPTFTLDELCMSRNISEHQAPNLRKLFAVHGDEATLKSGAIPVRSLGPSGIQNYTPMIGPLHYTVPCMLVVVKSCRRCEPSEPLQKKLKETG